MIVIAGGKIAVRGTISLHSAAGARLLGGRVSVTTHRGHGYGGEDGWGDGLEARTRFVLVSGRFQQVRLVYRLR